MIDTLFQLWNHIAPIFTSGSFKPFFYFFFPFVFIIELPYYLITIFFSIRGWVYLHYGYRKRAYTPFITVVITAYNESLEEIKVTMQAVAEQLYHGRIEVLVIIDNAQVNHKTASYAHDLATKYNQIQGRSFRVIEKAKRGGHANSMNLGLRLARGEVLIMMDADTSMDNQSVRRAANHFLNKNVIAVSGAVRVRNYKDNILTRLQAIEYMIGIQLGRFGLTELNVTNNISGAFGIFRTSFLKQTGGWLNGTAEDLDLTLRLHIYASRYPELKIIHEPLAVAWTAAPSHLKALLKQRSRWDGDLYYIYVRRHWRKFSTKVMSRSKLFFFSWYGLYYQLVLPFVIVFYNIILLIQFNLIVIIAVSIIVYLYYLVTTAIMFSFFLILVSERPIQDFKLTGWILLMPAYQMFLKFMAAFFILNEVLFKSHQESSMAPWWVIKKTK